MSASLRVFAPAKLNLHLHVGPPRADGRHPLESLAAFADVGDWLRVAPADGLSLELEGPFAAGLAAEADNLVLWAAHLLAREAGIAPCAHLVLEKNLPIASGIGGGSADAAAALRGLARLWSLRVETGDLERLAAELGSDVPVCVASRGAFMSGAGEITSRVEGIAVQGVLVNPRVPLSTGGVYRAFDEMGLGAGFVPEAAPHFGADVLSWLNQRRNDLEGPAIHLCPAVETVLTALASRPECLLARMSGSGATCFALCADRAASQRLALAIQAAHPDWWVAPAGIGDGDAALLAGQVLTGPSNGRVPEQTG